MIDRAEIHDASLLVVDDNAENIALLLAVLALAGYNNVSSTANARDVARLHAEHRYDLILLDMQMPGLNGLQVIQALREVEASAYVPVIAITANPSFKIAALQAGARDFITKPFDLAEVHQRIHNLLEVRLLYKKVAEQGRIQKKLALHDALTGLPNRRLLEDRIASALQQAMRSERCMAVFYMDLDGFKAINDQHGHECGDRLLQMVADRLGGVTRQQDTVARIGGDEFVMLLPDLHDMNDVMRPALKILDVMAMPFNIKGLCLEISTSIGIAGYPYDGTSVAELITRADAALYQAKRAGRNRFHMAHLDIEGDGDGGGGGGDDASGAADRRTGEPTPSTLIDAAASVR
jgi:two-component system cell cycle response regulator